jgi:hypothetical protein
MAFEMLQTVVGMAVIDADFRSAILNGSRRHAIERFDLSHEETAALMSIQAKTLDQFAGELDQWIMQQLNRFEPPPLDLPAHPRTSPRESKPLKASAPVSRRPGLRTPVSVPASDRLLEI